MLSHEGIVIAISCFLPAVFVVLPGCGTESDSSSPGAVSSATVTIAAISPSRASARGNIPVTITGEGFQEGAVVRFGDVEAPSVEVTGPGELLVVAPMHLASATGVTIVNPDGSSVTQPEAFVYEPLQLQFMDAPAHYLPDLSPVAVSDAVAADIDGDGDQDLIVAARGGFSRVLRNNGAGGFIDDSPPQTDPDAGSSKPPDTWKHETAALLLHDFDGDSSLDVFACNAGGQPSAIYLNDGKGKFKPAPAGTLPGGSDECSGAALADVDGDGKVDLVVLGRGRVGQGRGYLRVYLRTEDDDLSFAPLASIEPNAEVEGKSCGSVSAVEASATYTLTQEKASTGAGAGVIEYDFLSEAGSVLAVHSASGISEVPEAVEVELLADASVKVALRLIDAQGEEFVAPVSAASWTGWSKVTVSSLSSWASASGDGVIDAPISSIGLRLTPANGAAKGLVHVDNLRVLLPDSGPVIIEDFERADFVFSWPERLSCLAAADFNGDGAVDFVIASDDAASSSPLRMVLNERSQSSVRLRLELTSAPVAPDPISHVAAFDVTGDGGMDLLAISSTGQDRLFLNDGRGYFFDDTATSMPVDRVAGRWAAVQDMDLDGRPDIVIANAGAASRLYINAASRFIDHTPAMPLRASHTLRAIVFDADGDGDQDVFLLNQSERSRLYVSVEEKQSQGGVLP